MTTRPLLCLLLALACVPLQAEDLKPIFDGQTLTGWTHRGGGEFHVENGVIRGTNGKGKQGWLCTDKIYGDFIMELEINITSGNSGVQLRSHLQPNDFMVGYQIEVDPTARAWSGGLYDQGRRNWLQDMSSNAPARKAFKLVEWNKYRIVCRGDSIKSWVNGVPATDFIDSMDKDGIIALQAHPGTGTAVRFRNIRVQDLGKNSAAVSTGDSGVQISEGPESLKVTINGQPFTEYFFKDVPRPYFYPLLGPGQLPMTRNWPMKNTDNEEHDHPHHRSLWFAHGLVNGQDFWTEAKGSGKTVHDGFTEIKSGKDFGLIRSKNKWVAADGSVFCTDDRLMRIYNRPDDSRLFDFEITIHASNGDVTFGDTKEGSMAVRLAETMRLKQPKGTPGQGHIVMNTGVRDGETWGKAAAWVDYYGPVEGKTVGLAIFDHPENSRHPTTWHVRDYGLFAANPFGWHDFEKKPAGAGDLKIPAGKNLTFRYRFYMHNGDEKQADVAALYAEYAKTAPETVK